MDVLFESVPGPAAAAAAIGRVGGSSSDAMLPGIAYQSANKPCTESVVALMGGCERKAIREVFFVLFAG